MNEYDAKIQPTETRQPESERAPLRAGTFILLAFLVLAWPGLNIMFLLPGEYEINFDLMDPVLYIYLPTIIIEWLIFAAVALVLWREKTGFPSVGLVRPKLIDLPRAVLFIVASNLVLLGLQVFLAGVGLTVNKNVDLIVDQAGQSVWWWLAVSITAAVCEETAFRGFILTRVQRITRGGWLFPVLLSTVAFATGHIYQGWGGFILIFAYGMMFCGLYIITRSLWPGILAHFIQDFSAIFVYKWFNF